MNFNQIIVQVISKLLEEMKPNKAVVIDNLAGRFLQDGFDIIAEPITTVIILSTNSHNFPMQERLLN